MKGFKHAKGSVARHGGKPDDYIDIHDFIDHTKMAMPDMRHRAILHNAWGCFMVERVFGRTRLNSEGREYSTRDIAEEHIIEDLGFLPSLEDWLDELPLSKWHGGIHRLKKEDRPLTPEQEREATRDRLARTLNALNFDAPGGSAWGLGDVGRNHRRRARHHRTRRGGLTAMALKTMIKRITDAKAKYDAELAKAGKGIKKEIAKYLGAVIPEGFFLEWDQYTPYFNDGEPCIFSVNTPWLKSTAPMEELLDEDESHDADEEWDTDADANLAPVDDPGAEDETDDTSSDADAEREYDEDANERDMGDSDEDAGTFELYGGAKFLKASKCKAAGITKKQVEGLWKAWEAIPEEVHEKAFGDHTIIRIYADGTFRTEECSHD